MSNTGKGKIERDIVIGIALLGSFLLIHRIISNKMIKETDEK
jgi:hypothetical protein